jgi:hypothetical protein
MKLITTSPLTGNGTDFREFSYTGSSNDISGCWIAVTICVSGARHNILYITETWTPKNENNTEWRDSFLLKETHFSVKNDMQQQHGNTLTYDLVQSDSLKTRTTT